MAAGDGVLAAADEPLPRFMPAERREAAVDVVQSWSARTQPDVPKI